jgi:hypothetical protein
MVHAHFLSEVIVGALLGRLVSLVSRCAPATSFRLQAIAPLALAVLIFCGGQRAPTQDWIDSLAHYLSGNRDP